MLAVSDKMLGRRAETKQRVLDCAKVAALIGMIYSWPLGSTDLVAQPEARAVVQAVARDMNLADKALRVTPTAPRLMAGFADLQVAVRVEGFLFDREDSEDSVPTVVVSSLKAFLEAHSPAVAANYIFSEQEWEEACIDENRAGEGYANAQGGETGTGDLLAWRAAGSDINGSPRSSLEHAPQSPTCSTVVDANPFTIPNEVMPLSSTIGSMSNGISTTALSIASSSALSSATASNDIEPPYDSFCCECPLVRAGTVVVEGDNVDGLTFKTGTIRELCEGGVVEYVKDMFLFTLPAHYTLHCKTYSGNESHLLDLMMAYNVLRKSEMGEWHYDMAIHVCSKRKNPMYLVNRVPKSLGEIRVPKSLREIRVLKSLAVSGKTLKFSPLTFYQKLIRAFEVIAAEHFQLGENDLFNDLRSLDPGRHADFFHRVFPFVVYTQAITAPPS